MQTPFAASQGVIGVQGEAGSFSRGHRNGGFNGCAFHRFGHEMMGLLKRCSQPVGTQQRRERVETGSPGRACANRISWWFGGRHDEDDLAHLSGAHLGQAKQWPPHV